MAKEKFTKEETEAILKAVQKSWNYIAYDCIQMAGGEMPLNEVIECSVDAGRPVDIGKLDKKLYDRLILMSNKELETLLKPIFRFKKYVL